MVPKTKLGRVMIKKLHITAGSDHGFKDRFKTQTEEKVEGEQDAKN